MIKNLKLKIKNSPQGFTLIELIVTISVIGIVSSAVFLAKSHEEERLTLKLGVFNLSQNIREMQEKALSTEVSQCASPKKQCGFGMRFEEGQDFFTPFIDCADDCSTSNHSLSGSDAVLPDVSLMKKTKICSLASHTLDVVFSPPDPIVYLNNVKWGVESVIDLCLKSDAGQIKKVKLNNAGKIEIE